MSTWLRRTLLALPALVISASFTPLHAQADTTRPNVSLFTYRDGVLAAGFVLATLAVRPLDEHYAKRLQDSSTQDSRKLRKLATFVQTTAAPGSYIIGTSLYVVGRLSKNQRMASLGLHGDEALFLGEFTGYMLKGVIGRQRPSAEPRNPHSYGFLRGFARGDLYQSFPSGHSVAAFAAAAAVTSETSGWWPQSRWLIGPTMYGGATLVAVARMFDNRHWASDVIAGAAIGTFTGLKVVRFNNSHAGNSIDRWFLSGSLTPTSDGGHAVQWSLVPRPVLGRTAPSR
jgi:membrane-associated phospholipid phosphatase